MLQFCLINVKMAAVPGATHYRLSRSVSSTSAADAEEDNGAPPPEGHTEQKRSSNTGKSEPKDRFYLVYISMVVTGAGILFPYNSYIAAADYFYNIYPDKYPETVFPFTYMYITVACVLFTVATLDVFPLHGRILFGYVNFSIALLFVPLLDIGVSGCTLDTNVAFGLTVLSVVIYACGNGVQQSSYYGMAGMLPKKYTQAIQAGEGVAGVVVVLNRIITKAFIAEERISVIVFFVISLLFVWVCVAFQAFLRWSPFVKHHIQQCTVGSGSVSMKALQDDQERLINGDGTIAGDGNTDEDVDGNDDGDSAGGVQRSTDGSQGGHDAGSHVDEAGKNLLREHSPARDKEEESPLSGVSPWRRKIISDLQQYSQPGRKLKFREKIHYRWLLVKLLWQHIIAVSSTFFVTLLLYPGLSTLVQECSLGDWTPIMLVLLFGVTDLVGKSVAVIPVQWRDWLLLASCLSRAALVPLLVLAVSPSPTHPTVKSLVYAAALVSLLGLTGGYFGTMAMVLAPGRVPKVAREVAGTLMTLSLLGGLALGATFAYALVPLTQLAPMETCSNVTASVRCIVANNSVVSTAAVIG